jgi:hypothetical protein
MAGVLRLFDVIGHGHYYRSHDKFGLSARMQKHQPCGNKQLTSERGRVNTPIDIVMEMMDST